MPQKKGKMIGKTLYKYKRPLLLPQLVCDVKFILDNSAEISLEVCHCFNFLFHFYVSFGSSF